MEIFITQAPSPELTSPMGPLEASRIQRLSLMYV